MGEQAVGAREEGRPGPGLGVQTRGACAQRAWGCQVCGALVEGKGGC